MKTRRGSQGTVKNALDIAEGAEQQTKAEALAAAAEHQAEPAAGQPRRKRRAGLPVTDQDDNDAAAEPATAPAAAAASPTRARQAGRKQRTARQEREEYDLYGMKKEQFETMCPMDAVNANAAESRVPNQSRSYAVPPELLTLLGCHTNNIATCVRNLKGQPDPDLQARIDAANASLPPGCPPMFTIDAFGVLEKQRQECAAAEQQKPGAPPPTQIVITPEQLMTTLQVAAAREPESIAAEILGFMQYKSQLKGDLADGDPRMGKVLGNPGLYDFCF